MRGVVAFQLTPTADRLYLIVTSAVSQFYLFMGVVQKCAGLLLSN